MKTKIEIYKNDIEPLVDIINEVCSKNNLPMLIAICLERKDLGQGNMEMLIAGSSFLTESVKPPQPMLAAASILGIPGFENILIPNYEIVENVAVH